jgi:hypothetical protein
VGIQAHFRRFLRGCRILARRVPGPPHRRLRLPLGGLIRDKGEAMTAIQCISYEPLPYNDELLKQVIEVMVDIGMAPFYTRTEQTGNPEQAGLGVRYSDRAIKYKYISTHHYQDNPKGFIDYVLSNQKIYGDRSPELSFFTKSELRHFKHTVRFFSHLDGTRVLLNYVATGGDDRAPTAQMLLKLAKELFRIFKPIYTSIDFQYKTDPQSIRKSLRIRRIQELYWANLFDSEYVRTYGKDFFLNAPVWKVEDLADNGILIQLSPEIAPASKKAIDVEKIAHHFQGAGVKSISWPTNRYFKFPKRSTGQVTA